MNRFVICCLLCAAVLAPSAAATAKQAFLKVSPLAGESKTSGSNDGKLLTGRSLNTRSRSSTKTITRNLRWKCEVRYRGEDLPEKVEVRAFYIGCEADDNTPRILGQEVKNLTLDQGGKASVELESPTVKLTKTRSASGTGARSGRVAKTKSTTSGQRMLGCVIQLFEEGELVKSYSSVSQWERAAREKDFSDASLTRKDGKRLN